MHSVKFVNDVQVDQIPVECYYPGFNKRHKTLSNEFYKEFTLNKVTYHIGNFVMIDGEEAKVGKILCIFLDQTKTVQLIVRRYMFAKDLKEILLKNGSTQVYNTEVIEDFRKDYSVQANKILRMCFIIFTREDEIFDLIEENKLNSSSYFFCRFFLKEDRLFPILSPPSTILGEMNLKSPIRKSCSAKKQKNELELKNADIDMEEKETISKNLHKNIKPAIDTTFSPVRRNSVKRNLNESFGGCPDEKNDSILNYSIIGDEDSDNPFLLKLRISGTPKKPFVLLNKLNGANGPEEKEQKEFESPSLRKSTRKIQRKSYAEYISPIKSRKRNNSHSISDNEKCSEDSSNINSKNKELSQRHKEKISTPKKIKAKEEITSQKRVIRTPKKYQDEENWTPKSKVSHGSSIRKSLRLTHSREVNQDVTDRDNSKIEGSVTKERGIERTPQKNRVNLDDSIRRSILKINLHRGDLEKNLSPSNNFKKRRYKGKYTDDHSDSSYDDEDDESSNGHSNTTSPSTPKRRPRRDSTIEIDVDFSGSKTPKTNRKMTPKSSTAHTPKTPKNRAKLIRDGVITPSMQSRGNAVVGDKTPLMKARSQLHVSYVPNALPCRDKEYNTILNFIEDKLYDGCGGCIYISGVPGTGKTATVTSVISDLQRNKDVPKFVYVSINGMRLTDPKQSYVEILKQLDGKTVPWEQAQSILEEKFTKSKKMTPTVMLVDELDVLYTRRQDVVYNLLDWPTKAKNQLIVITIANTMDLPERLLVNRVASRLGLTRLTFQAYTHSQLQEIVIKRLSGTECFNPDAIQLVARKVASVSGDARRALDICRRAAEIAESESNDQLVTMNHVNKAVASMITQPKVRAIKCCSRLEQLLLQSIVAEVERTGVEETTFCEVFKMLVSCAAIEGFKMVSSTIALSAVYRLSACRLILTDPKCSDISQKIILNVSVDDVYYALKKDLA